MVSGSLRKTKTYLPGVQLDVQSSQVGRKSTDIGLNSSFCTPPTPNSVNTCLVFSSLCTSGFVILSTFVPTHGTCSVVLTLVHSCLLTTFSAELLSHMDYYIAIVWPFFHEEHFRVEDRTLKMCAISAMGKTAIQAKFEVIEILFDIVHVNIKLIYGFKQDQSEL